MPEVATNTSCNHEPIDNPKRIDIALHFTDKQFLKLKNGLIPERFEDKWFIYYENEWLYFHRSWTGFGIFKAQVIKEQDGYSIKEFWAERNKEKKKYDDDHADIESISFLIAMGLLGIDVRELYVERNIQSDNDCVNGWSNFGNLLFTNQAVDYSDKIKSVLFGVAVGDAVGVPYEFSSREQMKRNPATDMVGYGTHQQPPGTWSDDSSLTFCLAEALASHGYYLPFIAFNFHMWKENAWWTARNKVFDIGVTTSNAIARLEEIMEIPDTNDIHYELEMLKNSEDEFENGNGSLMRIIPLLFYIHGMTARQQFDITWAVSALTHRHIRAAMSCFIYLKLAEKLLYGQNKDVAYTNMRKEISDFWKEIEFPEDEQRHFNNIIQNDINNLKEENLKSGGYVIEVLESSIWFFLKKDNYRDIILSIINIGHDTDTSAAIAGGLAGLHYGIDGIPEGWLSQIARKDDIENLAERLATKLASL